MLLCSLSIEQAEKNGDSSETKPDAAVSISSSLTGTLDFLFIWPMTSYLCPYLAT